MANSGRLLATYFPEHGENRMKNEGDVARAREHFLKERPRNLEFLLRSRYDWMRSYLPQDGRVIELGSGAGFSKLFLDRKITLTDVVKHDWIDEVVDACKLPYSEGSVDAFVLSHMIHHVAYPAKFLDDLGRALKPGGTIVISEVHPSFLMRFILGLMKHEGWSFERDIWDRRQPLNNPRDPWSANCAISALLMADEARLKKELPWCEIVKTEFVECFTFLASGGVIAKTFSIQLPKWALSGLAKLDQLLCRFAPQVFAMGRRIVLKKKPSLRVSVATTAVQPKIPHSRDRRVADLQL